MLTCKAIKHDEDVQDRKRVQRETIEAKREIKKLKQD